MTVIPEDVTFQLNTTDVRSGDIEGLTTSTETPGGFSACRFSVCGPLRPELADLVRIYNSTYAKWAFVGRVSDIKKKGLTYDVTATRSTRDKTYARNTVPISPSHPGGETSERIYRAGTQLLTILTDALSITPDVFSGNIVNPGLQLVADSQDVGGFTAEQVWDYVSSLIGNLTTPLLWHIRAGGGQQVVNIEFQDIAARYFVHVPEDQIEENFSLAAIINEAAVSYGKGQIAISDAGTGVISIERTKYSNASNIGVTRIGDAQALADAYVARFNKFRSISDTITINCDKDPLRAVTPVTEPDPAVDNWPLYLVESGHGIQLLGRPSDQEPYNINLKYVTGTEYSWDEGILTLRCGEIRSLDSDIQDTVDYNVNRLFNGPYQGPPGGNHPLADADLLPKIGPEVRPGDPGEPPITAYGIAAFRAGQDSLGGDPNVPYGRQVDPDLVPDEGLEANVNFNPADTGFQAAVRVTPGTFNQYRLILGNSAGLVADTVVGRFYRVIPPSENPLGGQQLLFEFTSTGVKDRTATILTPVTLKRGDYAMIEVTTAGTTASWAAISLHAKKNFPSLK